MYRHTHRVLLSIPLIVFYIIIITSAAHAQCTSPAGVAGEMDYNTTSGGYEYCNGSAWVLLDASSGSVSSAPSTGSGTVNSNLEIHWKLDETTGSTVIDTTGNGYQPWIPSAAAVTSTDAANGTSYLFSNGANNNCLASYGNFPFNQSASFSASAWVKPSGSQTSRIMSIYDGSGNEWRFSLNYPGGGTTNAPSFQHPASGTDLLLVADDNSWSADTWHHFAITHSAGLGAGTDVKIYVDGAEVSYQTQTSATGAYGNLQNADLYTSWCVASGDVIDGHIDDVRLYDVELTSTQVSDLYDSTKPTSSGGGTKTYVINPSTGSGTVNSNLEIHWKLDETTGSTVIDTTGNGYQPWIPSAAAVTSTDAANGTSYLFSNGANNNCLASYGNFPFNQSASFSASAWVKPSGSQTSRIMSIYDGSGNEWRFSLNYPGGGTTNAPSFQHPASGTDLLLVADDNSWSADTWHHFAITHSAGLGAGTDVKIYVDGAEVSYQTQTSATGAYGNLQNADLYTSWCVASGDVIDGHIDDVRLYDVELTSTQVSDLYDSTGPAKVACSNEGEMYYDTTANAIRYCGGTSFLRAVGSDGSGGGGCAASGAISAGVAGTQQYDTDSNKLVVCDGANWVSLPY